MTESLRERKSRVRALIALLEDHDLPMVKTAVERGLLANRTDLGSLMAIASWESGQKVPFEVPKTPAELADWKPDLDRYTALCGAVAGND